MPQRHAVGTSLLPQSLRESQHQQQQQLTTRGVPVVDDAGGFHLLTAQFTAGSDHTGTAIVLVEIKICGDGGAVHTTADAAPRGTADVARPDSDQPVTAR